MTETPAFWIMLLILAIALAGGALRILLRAYDREIKRLENER